MQIQYKPMKSIIKTNSGVTLVELMVTLAIASIVLAGIYAGYQAQLRSHVTQQAVVDIQQNLRSSMYYLQRYIREAGLGADAGFADDLSAFPGYEHADAVLGANTIVFTSDADGDGCVDGFPDPTTTCTTVNDDNVNNELIAFRLNGNTLERYMPAAGTWAAVAQNIESIEFTYLDSGMNITASAAEISSVQITLTALPVQEVYVRAAPKRPLVLSAQVQCRNINL